MESWNSDVYLIEQVGWQNISKDRFGTKTLKAKEFVQVASFVFEFCALSLRVPRNTHNLVVPIPAVLMSYCYCCHILFHLPCIVTSFEVYQ